MKIAILILIHQYNEQQKRLVAHLSNDFDVYVHADARSEIPVDSIRQNERVFPFSEYKVYWGSFNQVLVTLFLLKKAHEKNYGRYVLISGSDVPIKPNAEIAKFFENTDAEFLAFEEFPRKCWKNGGYDRIDYFYANQYSRGKCPVFAKLFSMAINFSVECINFG